MGQRRSVNVLSKKTKTRMNNVVNNMFALVFVLFSIMPFALLVINSLKYTQDLMKYPLFAPRYTLSNYGLLFSRYGRFGDYLRNSLIVSTTSAVVATLMSLSGGYSLARFRFRGKKLIGLLFIMTQMFPYPLIILPIYIIMSSLGLLDTYYSLIITYSAFGVPFCTWILRSFIRSIPEELEEAAMIDGCGRMGAIRRVVLPLSLSGIVAAGMFVFVLAWNDILAPLVLTSTRKSMTGSLFVSGMLDGMVDARMWSLALCAGVTMTIPICLIFIFIQKYLVEGLTMGAVKG